MHKARRSAWNDEGVPGIRWQEAYRTWMSRFKRTRVSYDSRRQGLTWAACELDFCQCQKTNINHQYSSTLSFETAPSRAHLMENQLKTNIKIVSYGTSQSLVTTLLKISSSRIHMTDHCWSAILSCIRCICMIFISSSMLCWLGL